MNGKPWLPEHDALMREGAGRIPADKIAEKTGHCVRTVKAHMKAAGLEAYQHRPKWTRRDYLLHGAAGLMTGNAAW